MQTVSISKEIAYFLNSHMKQQMNEYTSQAQMLQALNYNRRKLLKETHILS